MQMAGAICAESKPRIQTWRSLHPACKYVGGARGGAEDVKNPRVKKQTD